MTAAQIRYRPPAAATGLAAGSRAADGRLGALINMIENAGDLVDDELITEACDQLLSAIKKTDGESPPKDFVAGPAAVELEQLIQHLFRLLYCKKIQHHPPTKQGLLHHRHAPEHALQYHVPEKAQMLKPIGFYLVEARRSKFRYFRFPGLGRQ